MDIDQRLMLGSYSFSKYHGKEEDEINNLEEQYCESKTTSMVDYLSKLVLHNVDSSSNLNLFDKLEVIPDFNDAFKWIEGSIKNERIRGNSDLFLKVLERRVGRKLSELTLDKFDIWDKVYKRFNTNLYEMCKTWIGELPVEVIEKNIMQIKKLPEYSHPLELMEIGGILRNKNYWGNFDENIEYNKNKAKDSWEYIELSKNHNDVITLGEDLELKNKLIKRTSDIEWIKWISELPLAETKISCINIIQSLDELERIINDILSIDEKDNIVEFEELFSIIIQCYIELCIRINDNLERSSKARYSEDDEEAIYRQKIIIDYEKWQKDELPQRLNLLVESIFAINLKFKKKVHLYMIRHISIKNTPQYVLSKLREILVNYFSKLDVNLKDLLDEILENNITTTSLLGSLLIFFEKEDERNATKDNMLDKFFECYSQVLDEQYFTLKPLNFELDYPLMVWLLAGVIYKSDNPVEKIKYLIKKKYISPEGWMYKSDEYFDSIRKVSQIITIGSMSVEWLTINKKITEAENMFEYIWNYSLSWIRKLSKYNYDDNIEIMLLNIWARFTLISIEHYSIKVLRAIKEIDELKYVLVCLKILLSNYRNKDENFKYNDNICKYIKERYEDSMPIVRNVHSVNDKEIEWYSKSLEFILS